MITRENMRKEYILESLQTLIFRYKCRNKHKINMIMPIKTRGGKISLNPFAYPNLPTLIESNPPNY